MTFAQQAPGVEPNRADLVAYLDMMFGYCDPGQENFAYSIVLRGLGEKGTPGEGVFNEAEAVTPLRSPFEVDMILGHMQRWAKYGRAVFVVPAAVSPAALSDKKATEERISLFTTLLVDIDSGDTTAKLAHATKYLGRPTMVVHSGGVTETGHPKLHAYWRLTEPSDRIATIAAARKMLALKIGADAAFGRCTQIIRMPGSVYGKNGVQKPCCVAAKADVEYELEDLLTAIEEMPAMDGIKVDAAKLCGTVAPSLYATGNGLNFVAFKEAKGDLAGDKPDIAVAMNSDIVEGGDADRNRWTEFNRVAGLHIHQARTRIISLDKAAELTMAWAELHMKPLWAQAKIDTEWRALLNKDIRSYGPMPGVILPFAPPATGSVAALNPNQAPQIDVARGLDGVFSEQQRLDQWRVGDWTKGDKPKRKFLVEGMIQAAKSHLLVAEGGAGKTFLLLDLGVKIASHTPERLQSWCGLPLAQDAGGTVVMFTTEDDREELFIRLADIVPDPAKRAALGKLIILPTTNMGGAFPLVERDRAQGPAKIGSQWGGWLKQLEGITDLRLVVIDTLNSTMHGEENSATVINEYVQAASAYVCGKFGATLIVTHHIRKPSGNSKIFTAEDMKTAIRGSTAIIGAFRVVLGIWHAPDFKGRLAAIGREGRPGLLYNFAVVKANNPEMAYGIRALLREPSGLLRDITDQEQSMRAAVSGEISAWFVFAVAYAAEQGHPFTIKSAMKKPPNGRKHQLPAIFHDMVERDVQNLAKTLVEQDRISQCNPKGSKSYNYLDVPSGPLAKALGVDGGAYRIGEGADFKPPNWEHDYTFHAVEGRIVPKGQEKDRTTAAPPKQAEPATDAPLATAATMEESGGSVAQHSESLATDATRATGLQFSGDCSNEAKG